MRMIKIVAIVLLLLLCASAFAQIEEPVPPAAASEPVSSQPIDNQPIGGAQAIDFTLMPTGLTVQPSFRFAQTMQGNGGLEEMQYTSTLGGKLGVTSSTQHNRLRMQYEGGATFSTRSNQENSSYHSINLAETATIRRWTLSAFDTASYSPESMGGSGLPGVSDLTPGANMSNLNSWLMPSQGILTLDAPRISNTVAAQAKYNFSYRNSLTVGGNYGLLRFVHQDFNNSDQYGGFASLERMLTPSDTVGVMYSYTAMTYAGLDAGMHVHSTQLAYARRITNRIKAHLAVGPELVSMPARRAGTKDILWGSDLGFVYSRNRYTVALSGSRRTTGGSGLSLGARSDGGTLTASRTLFRNWTASIQGGYTRTVTLTERTGVTNLRMYGSQVTRQITRTTSAYFSYSGQYQTTNAQITSPFMLDGWRHVFGVGIDWHPRGIQTRQ